MFRHNTYIHITHFIVLLNTIDTYAYMYKYRIKLFQVTFERLCVGHYIHNKYNFIAIPLILGKVLK